MRDLTAAERRKMEQGRCPFCNNGRWYEGPSGGLAQNIKCTNCGAEMNVGPDLADINALPVEPYKVIPEPERPGFFRGIIEAFRSFGR